MPTGTVVFFKETEGYGFVETDAIEEDVFVHMTDVRGPDLEEGQDLEFDIEQTDQGPRATNVHRL